jgi:hypothetical protein
MFYKGIYGFIYETKEKTLGKYKFAYSHGLFNNIRLQYRFNSQEFGCTGHRTGAAIILIVGSML